MQKGNLAEADNILNSFIFIYLLICFCFFLFLKENKTWHFMWIIYLKPYILWKKKEKKKKKKKRK